MIHKYISTKINTLLIALIVFSGCTSVLQKARSPDFEALYGASQAKQRIITEPARHTKGAISYQKEIKPILDARCVACHACYDAPCQLKLNSIAGLDRGATKQVVYDGARLEAVPPTRLFIDATSTEGWREKEFYPVLNERADSVQANLNNALLAKLLLLKRENPLPESGKLTDTFDLKLDRKLSCPTMDEFAQFKQDHPDWGMPYALPGLSLQQEYTIMQWLQEGGKFDVVAVPKDALNVIGEWEAFFNRRSLKQQLVSRYIYEHLFLGHIHFQGRPEDQFYRLIRSTTPPGKPIKEIASLLPYDDPGVAEFYYRFRPIEETIVDKTHFVYELDKHKMQRYDELFFQAEYSVTELPSYEPKIAANPFSAFAALPKNSLYQFLLDDAQYFISGFIKGPVCRGQIALNVIRDRFWVVFLKPGGRDSEPGFSVKFNHFLKQQDPVLSLPGTAGDKLGLLGWRKYNQMAEEYLKNKNNFANQLMDEYGGFQLDDLWDGDGVNQNAALTIFRHFDSATVVKGLVGDTPLTSWIIDYPLLERIHYLLVAGFNVYGSVEHQLASRVYMDFLRIDGENNFLRLLPAKQRDKIHASWYKGLSGELATYMRTPYYSAGHKTGVVFKTTQYKQELFAQIRQKFGKSISEQKALLLCDQEACKKTEQAGLQHQTDAAMHSLSLLQGAELDLLPEVSFVRIHSADEGRDLVYTLLLNKALKNVAIMISEDLRREPELDTLTVVPGFLGSYPNYFFHVEQEQLSAFVDAIKYSRSIGEKEAFYSKYGIRRTNPEIWEYVDWFNEQHKKYRGLRAGLFDLNRYENL